MPVLAYHEVTPSASSAYGVSVNQFEHHLELISQYKHTNLRDPPLITFDDGEASQYRYALPSLEKHGIKAIFFVNVGLVGSAVAVQGWHQHFMDWAELADLIRLGHQVQSHGWSHQFLPSCSDVELNQQLDDSRQVLADRLGIAVESLAFPGGRWNSRVLRACSDAGYKHVFSSDPWTSALQRHNLTLTGRFMVRRSIDARILKTILQGNYTQQLRLRMQGHIKLAARSIMGDTAYHALWNKLMRR